jgi:hypothetical protein
VKGPFKVEIEPFKKDRFRGAGAYGAGGAVAPPEIKPLGLRGAEKGGRNPLIIPSQGGGSPLWPQANSSC